MDCADNSTFALVSSFANRPPEVFLCRTPGAPAARVTTSPSKEWMAHKWVEPQLVTYKARDGARCTRGCIQMNDGAKRDPKARPLCSCTAPVTCRRAQVLVLVLPGYMFHHLLASRGYVVLDPTTAPARLRARLGTAIYRWMGGHDLNDVVDGAGYLVKSHKVNAKRIGVYGGSYGGFITLMALFTSPDTFAAGAALRPGRTGALQPPIHVQHPHEPQADAEAYRKSSRSICGRLKAPLLIAHGMVDVNVHFQDSVRCTAVDRIGKEDWELAVYPVEDHGFVEATSWLMNTNGSSSCSRHI